MNVHPGPATASSPLPAPGPPRIIYIVAPDEEAGGGMGRVKDYILRCPPDLAGRYVLRPLLTRDMHGPVFSLWLVLRGMATILWQALRGRVRVALVHVNMGDRGSAVRKALILLTARLCGVKTVLHLHAVEMDRDYPRVPRPLRWLIRTAFRQATVVVVLGARFRAWVAAEMDIAEDRIEILYNGVDVGARPVRMAAEGDTATTTTTILFLGNLIERKGLSDFIAALALIPADAPAWRAVVAGSGDVAAYRAKAAAAGVGARVHFTGWVDQAGVRVLLREAGMLVLPSYDEGLPLVILEALAMAVPVVCTPVGAIGEVLDDGNSALFTPVGDSVALGARMTQVLTDDVLRARLSQEGHARFLTMFSLDAFQSALLDIYRRRCGVDYRRATDRSAADLAA